MRGDAPAIVNFNLGDFLAEAKDRSLAAHVIAKGFNDFAVHKIEQYGPLLDQSHFNAHGREHGSVLEADHAAADDDQFPRNFVHLKKLIAGNNPFSIEGNIFRVSWPRAAGN